MKTKRPIYKSECDPAEGDRPVVTDAIARHPVTCPSCKEHGCNACEHLAEWEETYIEPDFLNELMSPEPEFVGWFCPCCGWQQDAEDEDWTRTPDETLLGKIGGLRDRLTAIDMSWSRFKPMTMKEIEEFLPEGDFDWSQDFWAEDFVPVACDIKECDEDWHSESYHTGYKRTNGVLEITEDVYSADSWECDSYWSSDPAEGCGDFDKSDIAVTIGEYRMIHYFYNWASYWLDCAETLTDPLGEYMGKPMTPKDWSEWCLKSVVNDIEYLEKMA